MKKMKGVVPVEHSSYALYQDSRAKFKHQSLMQDYEELQKVYTFSGFHQICVCYCLFTWVFVDSDVYVIVFAVEKFELMQLELI